MVARIPKLEVRCRRRELVDHLLYRFTKTCMLVSLQIGIQIVLCKTLVDFGEWVFFVCVFVSQLELRSVIVLFASEQICSPMTCSTIGCSAEGSPFAVLQLKEKVSSRRHVRDRVWLTASIGFAEDVVVVFFFVLCVLHELPQLRVRFCPAEAAPARNRACMCVPVRCGVRACRRRPRYR